MAMHSPNFRPWGDLGHPSVELGLNFFTFYSGLDVLCLLRVACCPHLEVWISTSERSKVKRNLEGPFQF